MNKTVKKSLKIGGITLLVLIVLLITLPFLFKDKIVSIVKTEVNKSLNAKVDFHDFGLSLFRNFPDFSLTIDDFSIVGVNEFEKDTLASVKRLNVVIDLMSVFGNDGYKIQKIIIDKPKVNLITLADGKSNMDILISDTSQTEASADTSKSAFKLKLKELKINNAELLYRDDSTRSKAKVSNLNFRLAGNMTQDFTTLKILTTIDSVTYSQTGVAFLNKARIRLESEIAADLLNSKYTFNKTEFRLNEILLNLEGFVAMPDSTVIDMDVKLSAPKMQFKDLLSLIPALYMKDFEKIQTKGELTFSAFAKGRMEGENYPAFGIDLKVGNAMFKYPDLPKSVDNINIAANISSKGGSLDNAIINVSGFHFELDKNPFDLGLLVRTPISDPDLNLKAKGNLNLNSVKDVYPLEDQTLSGLLKIDIVLSGRMSSIEKERYEDFNALGNIILENIKYASKDLAKPVDISSGHLEFSSKYLDLKQLNVKLGKSDLLAAGKVENYLPYVFRDQTIVGKLDVKSNYFDLKDIMGEEAAATASSSTPSAATTPAEQEPMTAIEIPKNINFALNAAFNKVIYDNIEIDNLKGNIEVKDQKVDLKNLNLNTLGSAVAVSGYYSAAQIDKPVVDLNLDVKELDIQKAFKTFNTVQKLMPVAEHTQGKVSIKVKMNSLLDKTLSPVLNTVQAKGNLQTSRIEISGLQTLEMIASATKLDKLKKVALDKVNIAFEIIDGNVHVNPFDVKMGNITSNISGQMGLDQTINYVAKMNVPRAELGNTADNFVSSLSGKTGVKAPENIKFDVLVGGTVTKPTVKVGATGMANELKEEVKKVVEEKIQEGKGAVNAEIDKAIAEATKQKEKLVAEATKQADAIRSQAQKTTAQIMDEADKQAQALVDKASNPIAKAAAKEAAKKVKQEAQAKVDKANAEADKQASNVINQAEKQGDKLIEDAKAKKLK